MVTEQTVEFNENEPIRVNAFAGLADDGTPFVQLKIGEQEFYWPCDLALHVGLLLQQLAYTSGFIATAEQVAFECGYIGTEEIVSFHENLVEAVFNGQVK